MPKYYIPHKIKEGDITHLADNDSNFAIKGGLKEEQLIDVQAPNGIFEAQVTFIEKNSVEVEILKQLSSTENLGPNITIIQGVSSIHKFGVFLEKITEIGVTNILPLISEYTLLDEKKARKNFMLWKKIVRDATEQSRNSFPPEIREITTIENLEKSIKKDSLKLAFATENVEMTELRPELFRNSNNIVMAFGPESGWSFNDIKILKSLGFRFVRLKGNILRTETTPIVATSIIKFILNQL